MNNTSTCSPTDFLLFVTSYLENLFSKLDLNLNLKLYLYLLRKSTKPSRLLQNRKTNPEKSRSLSLAKTAYRLFQNNIE